MSNTLAGGNATDPTTVVLRINNIPSSPTKEQIEDIVSAASDTLRSMLDPNRLETEGVKDWISALGVKIKAKVKAALQVDLEVSN